MACECDAQEAPSSLTRQQQQHEKSSSRRPSSPSSSPLPLSPKRSLFFPMDAAPLSPPRPRPSAARNPRSCGLAAVLVEAESRGRVLLGLRVQLPPAIEFGVKNRDSRLALLSPVQRSPAARAARSEAEEEYTCVIARGPNPRMTHIFDDRAVVQSSCDNRLGRQGDDDAPSLQQHRGQHAFDGNQCSYQEVFFDEGVRDTPDGEKLKA